MDNKSAIKFYHSVAEAQQRVSETFKNNKEKIHVMDVCFLDKYLASNCRWLDLGSGDGYIINAKSEKAAQIDCVEMFQEFSQHIQQRQNIRVHNQNLLTFQVSRHFDLITMFDVLEHFNDREVEQIYQNCRAMLAAKGKLIVKQQYGIEQKLEKHEFSQELQRDYYVNFQQIDAAQQMLQEQGFAIEEVCDIYPPEFNRWPNTHYYAMVAKL